MKRERNIEDQGNKLCCEDEARSKHNALHVGVGNAKSTKSSQRGVIEWRMVVCQIGDAMIAMNGKEKGKMGMTRH